MVKRTVFWTGVAGALEGFGDCEDEDEQEEKGGGVSEDSERSDTRSMRDCGQSSHQNRAEDVVEHHD